MSPRSHECVFLAQFLDRNFVVVFTRACERGTLVCVGRARACVKGTRAYTDDTRACLGRGTSMCFGKF